MCDSERIFPFLDAILIHNQHFFTRDIHIISFQQLTDKRQLKYNRRNRVCTFKNTDYSLQQTENIVNNSNR
jgi:hypothetical protein